LRASTRLGLQAARELSIDELDRFEIEPTKQIVLAQDLDIQSWIKPACDELSRRSTPLSLEEARMVGLDTAVEVFHLREQNRRCISCLQQLPFKAAENDIQIQASTTSTNQYTITEHHKQACQGLEVANDERHTFIPPSTTNKQNQCCEEVLDAKPVNVHNRGHDKESQQIRILSRGHALPDVMSPMSTPRTTPPLSSPVPASVLAGRPDWFPSASIGKKPVPSRTPSLTSAMSTTWEMEADRTEVLRLAALEAAEEEEWLRPIKEAEERERRQSESAGRRRRRRKKGACARRRRYGCGGGRRRRR
jgi:hypothetical protein